MILTKEEIIWIRKNTRPEDKKEVLDFLKLKNHRKKPIRKSRKKKSPVLESMPKEGSDRYKWIISTRNKLLSNPTKSEIEFYEVLSLLDIPFEKQRPFVFNGRIFFADAFFEKTKTIIEIDGGYHLSPKIKKKDNNRTSLFNGAGYKVIRIKNEDVFDRAFFLSKLSKHFPVKVDAYKYV